MMTVAETVPSPSRIGLDLIGDRRGRAAGPGPAARVGVGGRAGHRNGVGADDGECARCLTPITGDVEIDLTELFAYPDSATEATTEDDEVGHVVDDTIDLEQPIVDAVGLALPFSPLCGPDCPGLCPQCGVPLATAEPGHHHEQIDPRWAKLAVDAATTDDTRDASTARSRCSTRSGSSCPTSCSPWR